MSQEAVQLLMLTGLIGDCSPEQQAYINMMIQDITAAAKHNPPLAGIALGFVALDMQVNPKKYGLPG